VNERRRQPANAGRAGTHIAEHAERSDDDVANAGAGWDAPGAGGEVTVSAAPAHVLSRPDIGRMLCDELGWTESQHARWPSDTLIGTLLPDS
jgi:hypothetical protein